MMFCICNDGLELFAVGIAFKFVQRQHPGKCIWTVLHQLKIPDRGRYRNVVFFGYMSCGYRFSKAVDHVQDLTLRWPVVSWQKAIEFMKSLSALCTYISALSQVEIYLLPESRTVFNDLFSVVMNAVCSVSAAGAFMRMPGQLYFYMNWLRGFFLNRKSLSVIVRPS